MSIMIVEDDSSALVLYIKFIKLLGYEMAGVARDGSEALTAYKLLSYKPNVILMDYFLTDMTGLEVAKMIFKIDNSVKIILMSGNTEIAPLVERAGFLFLSKPFTIKELERNLKLAMKQD